MFRSKLQIAAERHRLVASTLNNPEDRAILTSYADEVQELATWEVSPPAFDPVPGDVDAKRRALGSLLLKVYPPKSAFAFEDLLGALETVDGAN